MLSLRFCTARPRTVAEMTDDTLVSFLRAPFPSAMGNMTPVSYMLKITPTLLLLLFSLMVSRAPRDGGRVMLLLSVLLSAFTELGTRT